MKGGNILSQIKELPTAISFLAATLRGQLWVSGRMWLPKKFFLLTHETPCTQLLFSLLHSFKSHQERLRHPLFNLDARERTILFSIPVKSPQRDARTPAHNHDNVLLCPLSVRKTLAEALPQVAAVRRGQSGTARNFDKQASIVGESNAADGGIGIGNNNVLGVWCLRPLPRLLGHAGDAQRGGDGGDVGQRDVGVGLDAGVEAVGTRGFDREDVRLPARPAEAFDALHKAVEQAAAAHAAHDAVNRTLKLVSQLADDGGSAVPDVRVVKGRDIDAARVLGQEVLAEIQLGGGEVLADLEDLGAEIEELILEELGRGGGDDDGGGLAEGGG